ncbi:hypothetical protein DXX93_18695 [Thalassotalea euphylliae]|uniref:Uncharacterized protein n=1 Tax=Thalassotalea euphylliae TaxID=1655234 RepID=A0A3E0TUP5_9GAMM|nr:hypothetical protein [Thalassotalea euphylliae]REL28391.1 hypothetical protein DXX93_18695 [Thalassotalea euphylliae]
MNKVDVNDLAIVCPHIIKNERPILYIDKDEKDRFAFMCGLYDHIGTEGARLSHISHIVEADKSIKEAIENLKQNQYCERKSINHEWFFGELE